MLGSFFMRYTPPAASFFTFNRQRFAQELPKSHASLLFSGDLVPMNVDSYYRLRQNSNFYYLSGVDQEDSVLLIFPDAPRPHLREILFVPRTTEAIQKWDGWKYSLAEAREASGVQTVMYQEQFEGMLYHLVSHIEGFVLDTIEHDRNRLFYPMAAQRFAQRLRNEFPGHGIRRAAPILAAQREKKAPEEITQLRRAIDITEKAFRRVLGSIKPGMIEYEVEADVVHEFLRNGATRPAYDSIIAGGANACTLHYIDNSMPLRDGDLVLMDFGAEYGLYDADLTRTIPVNGKYTPRQRDVYNAVLRVHRYAASLLKPGTLQDVYTRMVGESMSEELIALGLIARADVEATKDKSEEEKAYRRYFYHGTSHFLGLDTHDVGNRYAPMQAGMVFTVEPGIYIAEEGIGIRIENNYLIHESHAEDLMATIPIEVDEIEALMAAGC
jgi:Xaa-Pro aminopeptidase